MLTVQNKPILINESKTKRTQNNNYINRNSFDTVSFSGNFNRYTESFLGGLRRKFNEFLYAFNQVKANKTMGEIIQNPGKFFKDIKLQKRANIEEQMRLEAEIAAREAQRRAQEVARAIKTKEAENVLQKLIERENNLKARYQDKPTGSIINLYNRAKDNNDTFSIRCLHEILMERGYGDLNGTVMKLDDSRSVNRVLIRPVDDRLASDPEGFEATLYSSLRQSGTKRGNVLYVPRPRLAPLPKEYKPENIGIWTYELGYMGASPRLYHGSLGDTTNIRLGGGNDQRQLGGLKKIWEVFKEERSAFKGKDRYCTTFKYNYDGTGSRDREITIIVEGNLNSEQINKLTKHIQPEIDELGMCGRMDEGKGDNIINTIYEKITEFMNK